MSRYSLNPDRLFDRRWRAGHPFHPRCGRIRRVMMAAFLAVLCGVIWAYSYATDAKRVRSMAEMYLSELTGGRVTVQSASLSLFEGLRLAGVKVYVDSEWDPESGPMPSDSLLFSARTIVMQYDPASLLKGDLSADRIIVEKPQVHLCHNVDENQWNYNRLGQNRRPQPRTTAPAPSAPPPLPEILLRNARFEIAELLNGHATTLGHMAIDGQFTPQSAKQGGSNEHYGFVLQSRGLSDALGPLVSGTVHLASGRIVAQLKQFEFGLDARAMLPTDVAEWWKRHDLGGRIDVPIFEYTPGAKGNEPKFRIETELNGVTLSVPSEEWMSSTEVARRLDTREALSSVHTVFDLAGFRSGGTASVFSGMPPTPPVEPMRRAPEAPAAVPLLFPAASAGNPADVLVTLLDASAIQLRQVSGRFIFTERGIDLRSVAGRVENNLLEIDGHIAGYNPDAAVSLRVTSAASEDLHIPASPRYIWSLPHAVREFYTKTRPQGTCRLGLDVKRSKIGGPIEVGGHVELVDASFVFDEFPYPISHTNGRIELTRDTAGGQDWILMKGLRGRGVPEGPNADRTLAIDGWIGPIVGAGQPDPGGLIRIRIADIASEPALDRAFPPDVREALDLFDAPGKRMFPTFRGDAVVEVYKDIGAPGLFKVRVDLDIDAADGMLVGFPYPLKKLSGQVRVREGYADIDNVRIPHPTADVRVSGMAAWKLPNSKTAPAKRRTDLKVTVRGLPIDEDLLSALPQETADWLRKMGVGGLIDVDGVLLGGEGGEPYAPEGQGPALHYSLNITLRDGKLSPGGSKFVVDQVAGRLHLTPEKLDVLEVRGVRSAGILTAIGQVIFGKDARSTLVVSAQNLALDPELYALLPPDAQSAWDEIRPVGTLDAEITFARLGEPTAPKDKTRSPAAGQGVTVIDLGARPDPQSTQPTALLLTLPAVEGRDAVRREIPLGMRGLLKPRDLSASIRTVPYPLQKVSGEVALSADQVVFRNIVATHGATKLTINGNGALGEAPVWTLAIRAQDLPADDQLRKALPEGLASVLDSVKASGTLDLELDKFVYRSGTDAGAATSPSSAPTAAADPELDIAGRIVLRGVTMDAGVLLEKVNGVINLDTAVRGSRLHALSGGLDIASLEMAGRKLTSLRGDLAKPAGSSDLTLTRMQASVGGGDLAGQVTLSYPDVGPSRYALSLFLRNADVRELAREKGEDISGLLTASLALEGTWDKLAARRGRGDVVVHGKEMYRMPLMLGLMQVTNLALPISSPFSSGTARYSVEGQKVTFERIELKNNNVVMSGDGTLDFGTKQVRMTFVTDNPGAFKVPFLQDLWRGAQQELLRIQVRGTVQEPTIENKPFGTFTTSVDEVFKGDKPKKK